MEVFFLLKKAHLVSVYGNCNKTTDINLHSHGFHDLEWTIILVESDLFVFIHLFDFLKALGEKISACSQSPMIYFIVRLVVREASFGIFVIQTLSYMVYWCTDFFPTILFGLPRQKPNQLILPRWNTCIITLIMLSAHQ